MEHTGQQRVKQCLFTRVGWVAQLVEQRTENPCVGGSTPPPATTSNTNRIKGFDGVSKTSHKLDLGWTGFGLPSGPRGLTGQERNSPVAIIPTSSHLAVLI